MSLKFAGFWVDPEEEICQEAWAVPKEMRRCALAEPWDELWPEFDVLERPGLILYAWPSLMPMHTVKVTNADTASKLADARSVVLHSQGRHHPGNLDNLVPASGVGVGELESSPEYRRQAGYH